MAATRLRRTFHYPTESSDEDAVEEGMDEQDQETLISTLSSHDTSSTRIYTTLLLILPLAPALLYTPHLLTTSLSTLASSVAALSSLLASAYALYYLPLPPVRINIINSTNLQQPSSSSTKGKSISRNAYGVKTTEPVAERIPVPYISDGAAEMLAKYLVPVNAVLCGILAVMELLQGRALSEGMTIGGGYVPGFVMAVVMFARRELRVVDLGELERLRYRTKGG
ncbi:hypothetical protein P280DRAFT_437611 [Massarina eburnea CBS 473.64]|uniref:Uncharacterized protein n=1 Tax=Massarina eburnea CBS 473.64 TaxID=1395130 RepID=A0A6A6RJ16_9PLEO|nr:hypothetical protein P280DRAFT_437611 [Massarina eburnea CBS 473.64]